MKAILMAAGLGTRLRPITNEIPKPLLMIGEKPLLAYHLEALAKAGIREVIINSHYLSEQIEKFVYDNNFGIDARVSFEPVLLGSAGTIRSLKSNLTKEDFLVIYADNLTNIDYRNFISYHKTMNGLATMACYFEKNPAEKGVVILDNDKRIVGMIEKPGEGVGPSWANAGIYCFKKELLEELQDNRSEVDQPYDIAKDLMTDNFFISNRINAYLMSEYLLDIGSLSSLEIARQNIENIIF